MAFPGKMSRALEAVQGLGFSNVTEYVAAHPMDGFIAMAWELRFQHNIHMAPLDLAEAYIKEAIASQCKASISDSLYRFIAERTTDGWRKGDFLSTLGASEWANAFMRLGSAVHERARAVAREVDQLEPEEGWKPGGADDDVITTALERAGYPGIDEENRPSPPK